MPHQSSCGRDPCTEFGEPHLAVTGREFSLPLPTLRLALAAAGEFQNEGNQWISALASHSGAIRPPCPRRASRRSAPIAAPSIVIHRQRRTATEVPIQAGLERVDTVVMGEQCVMLVAGVAGAEIQVEIFELDRPARRKAVFDTGARGPADVHLVELGEIGGVDDAANEMRGRVLDLSERDTRLGVEKRAVDDHAGPPRRYSVEPVIDLNEITGGCILSDQ